MKPIKEASVKPPARGDAAKKTQDIIRKLEEKKYQDNHLKELERRRFQEAKTRLKNFVVTRDPGIILEESEEVEQMRLLRYYKHRFCTFYSIMKEAMIAKRVVAKPKKLAQGAEEEESKTAGFNKVFSLNPS